MARRKAHRATNRSLIRPSSFTTGSRRRRKRAAVRIGPELPLVRLRQKESAILLKANVDLATIGDVPKKRKAIGPLPGPPSTDQRLRSPPPFSQSASSASQGGRKGHKRQKSDMSWYQSSSSGHSRVEESDRTTRGASPIQISRLGATHERSRSEAGRHSVSSLLSTEPADSSSVPHQGSSSQHYHHQPQDGSEGEPSTPYRTGGGEERSARRTSPEELN
jgi:hypothetical protein